MHNNLAILVTEVDRNLSTTVLGVIRIYQTVDGTVGVVEVTVNITCGDIRFTLLQYYTRTYLLTSLRVEGLISCNCGEGKVSILKVWHLQLRNLHYRSDSYTKLIVKVSIRVVVNGTVAQRIEENVVIEYDATIADCTKQLRCDFEWARTIIKLITCQRVNVGIECCAIDRKVNHVERDINLADVLCIDNHIVIRCAFVRNLMALDCSLTLEWTLVIRVNQTVDTCQICILTITLLSCKQSVHILNGIDTYLQLNRVGS